MEVTTVLQLRKTFKYNADYSKSFDDWEDIGLVESLASTKVDIDDDTYVVIGYFKVKSTAKDELIKQALDQMCDKGCSCEHDCCGHYFGSATDVVKVSSYSADEDVSEWLVKASYQANY